MIISGQEKLSECSIAIGKCSFWDITELSFLERLSSSQRVLH